MSIYFSSCRLMLASLCATTCFALPANANQRLQGTPISSISISDLHRGTPEIDLRLLNSYGPVAPEIQDYFIQARAAFDTKGSDITFEDPKVLAAAADHGRLLFGGPMLGDLSDEGVSIWLRPSTSATLIVSYTDAVGEEATQQIEIESPKPGVVERVVIEGLSSLTDYVYRVSAGGKLLAEGSFTTAPADDFAGVYRVGIGADFHKIGLHNGDLFENMLSRNPSVMFLLGDSAADDRREYMNLHRSDYMLRDTSPVWQSFSREVPIYATWDDHDYFDDDRSGINGGEFKHADRVAVRKVWHDNWNNPPVPESQEGIYFKTHLGPVEVFVLDTRSCRNIRMRGQYGSYLGIEQQKWIVESLRSSTAPFKLICSGTMWSSYVSKGKDSWPTWDTEALEEIFTLIEEEQISGVLLFSGDRHGARGFYIPRESGHSFVELGVGSLGGIAGPAGIVPGLEEQIFGYDGEGFTAFGELEFDTASASSTVTFRLISERGVILEEHQWSQADLTP